MKSFRKTSIFCLLATSFFAISGCAATTPVADAEPQESTEYTNEYDHYDSRGYGNDVTTPDDDWFYDYYDTNDLYDPVTDYDYGWDEEEFGGDDEGVFDDGVL